MKKSKHPSRIHWWRDLWSAFQADPKSNRDVRLFVKSGRDVVYLVEEDGGSCEPDIDDGIEDVGKNLGPGVWNQEVSVDQDVSRRSQVSNSMLTFTSSTSLSYA